MKMKLVLAALMAAGVAFADEKKGGQEMDAQMKQMMEYGTPGAEHEKLKTLVGQWDVSNKMWMKPGAPPEESKGKATFSWVLDGRWLKQDFAGDWAGQKFTGLGMTGYDKVRKEYVGTWMDSMSTGMAVSGKGTEKGGVISDEGGFADAMTGNKNRWYRSEWRLPKDAKDRSSVYTMYHKDEKGKEYKCMEMTYSRIP